MANYKKSRALETCEDALAILLKVNAEAHSDQCKVQAIRLSVLSNSMMMASARIENYLAEFVGDWVAKVNSSTLDTRELPLAIRARFYNQANVLGAYQSYAVSRDEHGLAKKIIAIMGSDLKEFFSGGLPRPRLNASWILHERKYPSPDNLRHLFKRLGVGDIFAEVQKRARKDIELTVRSFNDFRSELAHQGSATGITEKDVADKLKGVIEFLRFLDEALFSLIGEIKGQSLWTT